MKQTDRYIWKVEKEDRTWENAGPGWYFQNEVEHLEGPYSSRQEALDALAIYVKCLNTFWGS